MSNVLEFTLQSFTTDQLVIKVKNISAASLDKPLAIELYPLKFLVDTRINEKATEAATNPDLGGFASLNSVVTGAQGWSAWAKGEMSNTIVVIMLLNDIDKDRTEITPIKLDPAAEFTILVPLNPQQPHQGRIDLDYSYTYNAGQRQDGKLQLKSADTDDWTPDVTLTTDHQSPTMITPATDVKIFWHVKDGVSATLRGPLPGGNSEWSLSSSTTSDYKMSDGWFQIKAVGPMTYILQAEVTRPGKPNVQVIKMLSLDVYTKGKYGYVDARPDRVLPFGLVELDWAAWGVNAVTIEAAGGTRKINLTEMTLSGQPQGIGVMRITAGRTDKETSFPVKLKIEIDKKPHVEAESSFTVIPWRKMQKSVFTGQPIGLAVAAPKMALLTSDGLRIAKVGEHDFSDDQSYESIEKVEFSPPSPTDKPKAWLAIAAFEKKFVVLRQTNDNDLQVAFYAADGKPDEILPLDLPADLRPFMGSGTFFDLVVQGKRAYVILEAIMRGGTVRRAFSVGVNSTTKKAEYRAEPLLECLRGYKLMVFDDALYALNRNSGQMLRFELTTAGKLEVYKAASAVDQNGSSMVRQGVLVPTGRVLAVLSPSSLPSLASLAVFGLKNILSYENLSPPRDPNTIPQDLVYSPQNNRWSRCGHGLDVKEGVVAFRGGDSQRLWLIEPNCDTYTLTVSSEHLFLHDYVTDLPSKPLAPFFDKTRQFTIINNSGMDFVPPNETCIKAGLTAFSASGPVELVSLVTGIKTGNVRTFELRFNEADAAPVTLRFLMQRPARTQLDYVCEVTLYGVNLSSATAVCKRVTVDGSVVEVPGTRQSYGSTLAPIEFSPGPLINGVKLLVQNVTPYQLWLRSTQPDDGSIVEKPYNGEEISINYSTTPLSIYAHGAGELFFDVDFAMPNGIEETFGDESQTKRICIRNRSQALRPEVLKETSSDSYLCALRYKLERDIGGVFIGDAVPSKDGSSIYVPLMSPAHPTHSEVQKIPASHLIVESSVAFPGSGVFSAPNSLVVLSDRLVAIFKDNIAAKLTFQPMVETGLPLSWHDVVTNLKGSPNDTKFFTLGMKREGSNPPRYSYSFAVRSFSQRIDEQDFVLDAQKGFRPPRVPGAPAWVSPNTISPMDVAAGGGAAAICVEGGIFWIDVKRKTVTEIAVANTGREEAVLIDPVEPLIFCAHSRPDNQALIITRIDGPNIQSVTLSGPVTHMATDQNPPAGVNLKYNRPRAVSLVVTPDALFVSHARKIYVLDKKRLNERQQVTIDLPCRLIQVRRGKPPGDATAKYSPPRDCWLVWAIGSIYIGDGQSAKKFQTKIYKIAML